MTGRGARSRSMSREPSFGPAATSRSRRRFCAPRRPRSWGAAPSSDQGSPSRAPRGKESKFGKALANTPFVPSERSRHMADMWDALINTLSVRSAYIGIRRKVFPHTAQSDASFSRVKGWCWARGHGPFVRCSNDSWRVLGTFRKRVVVGKFGV